MNILAISYAYPPIAQPRSIQVSRLLSHTSANIVVFCAKDGEIRTDAGTESSRISANRQEVIRVPWRTSSSRRLINRLSFRFLPSYWLRHNKAPDKYIGWKDDVIAQVAKYLSQTGFKPDIVVTFAQPFTDHLIGLELKRRYDLKWAAHFSDPWTDNPFNEHDELAKELNYKLEDAVIRNADIAIFTSEETIDLVYRKYSEEARMRARVLPHCFDQALYGARNVRKNEKLLIRHVGSFYGNRTPAPLIEAIHHLTQTEPSILSDVHFEFIGYIDEKSEAQASSLGLKDELITIRKPIEYLESIRLIAESDGLLVIDAPEKTNVFLPSKLIDYLGSGKPLFGITPEGTTRNLLEALGGFVSAPENLDCIVSTLKEFIELLKIRRAAPESLWGDGGVRDRYMAVNVSREFLQLLGEVTTTSSS